jgi:hypothetical protein
MRRAYYSSSIVEFSHQNPSEILGILTENSGFAVELTQRDAWLEQIAILKGALHRCRRRIEVHIRFE